MSAPASLSWRVVLTIEITALVCGTFYSLTRKYMNLTRAEGLPGNTSYFRHPLYQGLWCFVGQLLAWPIWWRLQQREQRRQQATAAGSPEAPPVAAPTSARARALCVVPTLFDVCGTVLNNTGLILTSVSVYQMLRGSVVLFTALASRLLLGTSFARKEQRGLLLIGVGIAFIGMANTVFSDKPLDEHYAPWPALGNVLILLSQARASAATDNLRRCPPSLPRPLSPRPSRTASDLSGACAG